MVSCLSRSSSFLFFVVVCMCVCVSAGNFGEDSMKACRDRCRSVWIPSVFNEHERRELYQVGGMQPEEPASASVPKKPRKDVNKPKEGMQHGAHPVRLHSW